MKTAKDIMTRDVVTISPDATVGQAVDILLNNRISGLPVTESDGRLVGIISEFGLLTITYDSATSDDLVSEHMTSRVISVPHDASVKQAADEIIINRIRRLPVVEDGRFVGMISRRDILKAVREDNLALT